MRIDGKLIITKINQSSKYYKPESKESKSKYTPTNTYFKSIASYADFEDFSEATPTLSKFRNDNIQAKQAINNFRSKQAINSIQPKETNDKPLNEPANVDYIASTNNDIGLLQSNSVLSFLVILFNIHITLSIILL